MNELKLTDENPQIFKESGCCLIKNVLDIDLCNFLSTQIELDSLDTNKLNSQQVAGSIELYNTQSMQITNNLTLDKIKNYLELKQLFSTYSFYRKYYKFQTLDKHIDRPECEISISVCLGMEDKTKPWPIYFENTEQNTVYRAEPSVGDGVLYLGMKLPHWRKKCEQKWVKQAFFHYSTNRELEFDPKNADGNTERKNLIKIICENL
jgi:hypothetical protein